MFGSLCPNEFTLPVLTISIAALAHISRRRSALVIVYGGEKLRNFVLVTCGGVRVRSKFAPTGAFFKAGNVATSNVAYDSYSLNLCALYSHCQWSSIKCLILLNQRGYDNNNAGRIATYNAELMDYFSKQSI